MISHESSPSPSRSETPETAFPVPNAVETGNQGRTEGLILTPLPELLSEPPETHSWLWEGILISGGLSLVAARPKVGKSTLVRGLSHKVTTGAKFLDRTCQQGRVIYLALEEKRSRIADQFRYMNADSPSLFVYTGPLPTHPVRSLEIAIEQTSAILVVVDPLVRLIPGVDLNDYAHVTAALAPIEELARRTNCHITMSHHLGKSDRGAGEGIIGSTAIFGIVDTAIVLRRNGDHREMTTIQRYGDDLEPTVLELDPETDLPLSKGLVDGLELRRVQGRIAQFVASQGETVEKHIRANVEGRTKYISEGLRILVSNKVLTRDGTGKGGRHPDPFRYALSQPAANTPSSPVPSSPLTGEGTSEQESA